MPVIPFPEFTPDMPDLSQGTDIALNVHPETAESYAPVPSLKAFSSSALNSKCLGSVATRDSAGTISLWAGTATKLYRMIAASTAWIDVSKVGNYTTIDGDNWHFEVYSDKVFATNFNDPIQSFLQGTDTLFSDLSPDAPHARYMCTPKDFLMVGNTSDPVGGVNEARVWWSGSGDPTSWPTPGSALAQQQQSDFNDFQGDYGPVTGMVDSLAGADVAIFFERAVWRGVYAGPPTVFNFIPAENARGTRCPNGIVTSGALVYYPADDGFYVFDGSQSTPIGSQKFDQWFWSTVNQNFLWNVIGAADPLSRAIIWIFPSVNASNGIPDTALIYRWDLQRASYAQFSADWLMRILSFGVTLDGFFGLGFTQLDTIPASLDSRQWIGGALNMGVIDTGHHLATFGGPNLPAQIATSTMQATPGKLSWVSSSRPLVQLTTGTPTIAIASRNNQYDPIVYGPDIPPDINGDCPQRAEGRYQSALLKIPAGAAWTHAVGVDATADPSGER